MFHRCSSSKSSQIVYVKILTMKLISFSESDLNIEAIEWLYKVTVSSESLNSFWILSAVISRDPCSTIPCIFTFTSVVTHLSNTGFFFFFFKLCLETERILAKFIFKIFFNGFNIMFWIVTLFQDVPIFYIMEFYLRRLKSNPIGAYTCALNYIR